MICARARGEEVGWEGVRQVGSPYVHTAHGGHLVAPVAWHVHVAVAVIHHVVCVVHGRRSSVVGEEVRFAHEGEAGAMARKYLVSVRDVSRDGPQRRTLARLERMDDVQELVVRYKEKKSKRSD